MFEFMTNWVTKAKLWTKKDIIYVSWCCYFGIYGKNKNYIYL